jgi:hypothetical protein
MKNARDPHRNRVTSKPHLLLILAMAANVPDVDTRHLGKTSLGRGERASRELATCRFKRNRPA